MSDGLLIILLVWAAIAVAAVITVLTDPVDA